MVGVPREHAKSTFWSFGFPLHNVIFGTRRFNVLISDTNDLATNFVMAIKAELEENKRLLYDYGPQVGIPWTHQNIVTTNDIRVWARGYGEPVRGCRHGPYRPDFIIADDFENDRTVRSVKQTESRLDWIKEAVFGSMSEFALFAIVGNLFSPRSAISQMVSEEREDGEKRYKSCVYQAILDQDTKKERPLWPSRWPLKRLKNKREQIGEKAFLKEFLNQVNASDAEFKSELVSYFDQDDLDEKNVVVTFCDPSGKNNKQNDYKAIITVSLDRTTMIYYVVSAWIQHGTVTEMLDQCFRQHSDFGGVIGIEENMFGDFLHEAIQAHSIKIEKSLPWEPIRHNTNKEARITGTLSYIFQSQKLKFRKNHTDQNKLVEQLLYLEDSNVNDDGPDALEGAVALIQTKQTGFQYKSIKKRRFETSRGAL